MGPETEKQKEDLIRTRLILIFAFLVAGVLVAGYLFYRGYERQYQVEVEHQLTAIADLKVAQLVQWRSVHMKNAEIIFYNIPFSKLAQRYLRNPLDGEAELELSEWIGLYSGQHDYDQVRLLDPQGVTRMSFPARRSPASVAVSRGVSEVLQSRRITIVDLYRHDYDSRIYLSVLIPILDVPAGKKVIGVLSLRVDPEKYLYPFILRWPIPSRTAETLLVRRDGNYALYLNNLRSRKNSALEFRVPLEKKDATAVMAVQGRRGTVHGLDYLGAPVIADARAVPDSPWFLVTRMNTSEMFAPARRQLWMLIGFVAALLFGSGSGLAIVWRQQAMRFYKERYLTAEALRESEKKLNDITSNLAEGIYVLDEAGRITFMNPEAERLLGWTIEEMNGKGSHNLVHYLKADGTPLLLEECNMHKVIKTGERYSSTDEVFVRKDGTVFPISVISAPLLDGNKVVASVTAFRDITENKKAEKELKDLNRDLMSKALELERAYKDMESFSYSVSHDLRAPIRIINGLSDMVMKDYPDKLDEDGKNLLRLIQENSQRMDQLVLALLDLFRTGRQDMTIVDVDMEKAAKLVADDLKALSPGRKIEVNINTLPPAQCDLKLIRQVFANLLSNAFKFTKDRDVAYIEIGSRQEGNEKVYYVKDNGAGFDMEQADRLFKVFQRLHGANEFEGIGIGLSIVQRIIQRHGGRIWAEGNPNEGAAFYFTLP